MDEVVRKERIIPFSDEFKEQIKQLTSKDYELFNFDGYFTFGTANRKFYTTIFKAKHRKMEVAIVITYNKMSLEDLQNALIEFFKPKA